MPNFEERVIECSNVSEGAVRLANSVTGADDSNIADAVKTLIDGYGQGGDGDSRATFTEVSQIPSGRSFSINTDFDRCAIVLLMTASASYVGGLGYNGKIKNQGQVIWGNTNPSGYTIMYIDNVNLILSSIGFNSGSVKTSQNVALDERARNIQPHWVNSALTTSGGYWTIDLS